MLSGYENSFYNKWPDTEGHNIIEKKISDHFVFFSIKPQKLSKIQNIAISYCYATGLSLMF